MYGMYGILYSIYRMRYPVLLDTAKHEKKHGRIKLNYRSYRNETPDRLSVFRRQPLTSAVIFAFCRSYPMCLRTVLSSGTLILPLRSRSHSSKAAFSFASAMLRSFSLVVDRETDRRESWRRLQRQFVCLSRSFYVLIVSHATFLHMRNRVLIVLLGIRISA